MKHATTAAALLAAAWLLTGCAAENPPPPIPAPMADTIPKPPVTATPLIWQPGHWDWNGNAYSWVPGQYVAQGGHSDMWMPAYWEKASSGWVWHSAHWM